jgi:predicted SnoaL-like aldol condensation-catalyzing enzyme
MSQDKSRGSVNAVAIGMLLVGMAIGFTASHFLAPGDAAELLAEKQKEEANMAFVRAFFQPDFTDDQKFEALDKNYIQHNPIFHEFNALNNTGGQDEFRVLRLAMSQRGPDDEPMFAQPAPGSPEWSRVYKVFADGDYVTVMSTRYSPNPLRPGEFYEHFWFDTWRMKDGKLAEHWDPQTIPDEIPDFLLEPVKQ